MNIDVVKKHYPGIDLLSFTPDDIYLKLVCIQRQREILALVNTEEFRREIGLRAPRIIRATPNTLVWDTGDRIYDKGSKQVLPVLQGNFYIGKPWLALNYFIPMLAKLDVAREEANPLLDLLGLKKYQNEFIREIRKDPVSAMLHFADLRPNRNLPFVQLVTNPFNTSAGDGYVAYEGTAGATLTTVHDAATGTIADYVSTTATAREARTDATPNFTIARLFTPADTSAIGAGGTISAEIHKFYVTAISNGDTDILHITQASQASTSSLATSDYSNFPTAHPATDGGSISFGSLTVSAWNQITDNATAQGWINVTGFTKTALRGDGDQGGNHNQAYLNSNNLVTIQTSEGANKPYLDITYTPVPKGGLLMGEI